MLDSDVIIAGAGPVGSVAALYLAQRGISVILLESGQDCAQDLRASTFHAPTLEMLDELGVAQEILDRGLRAPIFQFRERRSNDFLEFDLTELSDMTRFPYRVQCEQHVLARHISKLLLAESKAQVCFSHRVVAFHQDQESVTVAIETPHALKKLRSRYLIAADGGNSIIRKWLGAEFEGFTYPEKFLCLSTELELRQYIPDLAYVNYVSDPDEWLVLLRVPRVWRILVPADMSIDDDTLRSDAKRDEVFMNLIGKSGVRTEHRTIYRVHQRVVNRFDHGRVFLVGDAAHLNNPLGGFGMNSGIHDVWNLGEKIVSSLRRGHNEEAFKLFGRQRSAVTHKFIQAQTIQNKYLLDHGGDQAHKQRWQEMRSIRNDPAARRQFLLRQAMFTSLAEAAAIE